MHCPVCGIEVELVHVHGHAQCPHCGTNVEPCCAGAGDEIDPGEAGGRPAEVETLLALLHELGGATSREALLNRFAARTGTSLADGERALEMGRRRGLLVALDTVVTLPRCS